MPEVGASNWLYYVSMRVAEFFPARKKIFGSAFLAAKQQLYILEYWLTDSLTHWLTDRPLALLPAVARISDLTTEGEGQQSRQGLRTMSHSSYRSTTTTSGRSSIGTEEYPNFHGNTRLAQTQSYFDLTGNFHVVHSLDVEMDSSNWNLRGHSV